VLAVSFALYLPLSLPLPSTGSRQRFEADGVIRNALVTGDKLRSSEKHREHGRCFRIVY